MRSKHSLKNTNMKWLRFLMTVRIYSSYKSIYPKSQIFWIPYDFRPTIVNLPCLFFIWICFNSHGNVIFNKFRHFEFSNRSNVAALFHLFLSFIHRRITCTTSTKLIRTNITSRFITMSFYKRTCHGDENY